MADGQAAMSVGFMGGIGHIDALGGESGTWDFANFPAPYMVGDRQQVQSQAEAGADGVSVASGLTTF